MTGKNASGFILKNAQKGEIFKGIKTVNNFHPFYCKATEAKIIKIISKRKNPELNRPSNFSEREIEVIKYIGKEKSSEDIGQKLFISKRTVDGIRAKILSKMNVKSSVGMMIYALKNNLITLNDIWTENEISN